ncbi:MAG: hypothetical protein VX100_11275 [Pseudomonadota bacterium]|nr:hypothetical protein [Pseudomonadota bacterium]
MKRNYILALALLTTTYTSLAFDLTAKCLKVKEIFNKQPHTATTWQNYSAGAATPFEQINANGFGAPVVLKNDKQVTVDLLGLHPLLVFNYAEEEKTNKWQKVDLYAHKTYQQHTDVTKQPDIVTVLKESLNLSPESIKCNYDTSSPKDLRKNLNEQVSWSTLLTIKSFMMPEDVIGAIKIKNRNAVIIRSKSGFEYYESNDEKAIKITVNSQDKSDLDSFIATVESNPPFTTPTEITAKLISGIHNNNIADWQSALTLMKREKYTVPAMEPVHIRIVTIQHQL